MKGNYNTHKALRHKRHVRANAGDKRQYGDVVVRFWRERRDWGDSREIVESPVYVDDYGDLWVDTGSGLARLSSVCDGGLEVVTDSENRMSGLWNSMTIDLAIERGLDPEEEVVEMRKSSKRNVVALKRKTALLDDDVYRQSEQIVDDVEGELDYENAYYSHDALLSMYDMMRDAIDAFATSKFLGADESVLGQQWREAIDRTRDFLDATGSVFTAGEVVHAYADVLFAKYDRPYSRDAYGSRNDVNKALRRKPAQHGHKAVRNGNKKNASLKRYSVGDNNYDSVIV